MTTNTSFDTTVPPMISSSPLSLELPNIGSLTITSVVNGEPLQAAQKSSDDAMQTLQRQQTQPAATPTLTPSRVNTSVADDLDDLLNETLEEFFASSSSSSSSSVQSTASSSFALATIELDFDQIEALLCSIVAFPVAKLVTPSKFHHAIDEEAIYQGQLANDFIKFINQFFQSLLAQSANPEAWLELASKTPFFCNTHPFGASCFLMIHLDKAEAIRSHLNQKLLTDWKDNYKKCVLLLKKSGLDRYNITEFPFSAEYLQMISMVQNPDLLQQQMKAFVQNPDLMRQGTSAFAQNPEEMLKQLGIENPQYAEMMGGLLQNPQTADLMRKQMSAFAQDPAEMLKQLRIVNPQFAEMMDGLLQNPQTAATIREGMSAFAKDPDGMLKQLSAQMEAQGSTPAAVKLNEQRIQSMLVFFKELDQVLQRSDKNAGDVEVWLKTEGAKSTYQHPFYYFPILEEHLSKVTLPEKDITLKTALKVLYESCCERLTALGLQRYIDAIPKQVLDEVRQLALSQKGAYQDQLSKSVSFLRPLSVELKKLNLIPAALEANRQTIESWITSCKADGTYYPAFIASADMCRCMPVFEGILDGEQLQELNVLYPSCRDQLLALGLKEYLTEMPAHTYTTTASTTAAVSAPKKAVLDTERFKKEIAFFREMLQQKDEALDEWLKENSPKSDYPLLWAKKRMPQLSHFRDTVDIDLRSDWRMCSEACLEKIEGPKLSHHMDIANIPADASAELRAYLA